MCAPEYPVYPLLALLLQSIVGPLHASSHAALTALVWALLAAQSLHPADLARALPALRTAKARQAFRRVRRVLGRAVLRSTLLTPLLVRAVLRVVPDPAMTLVLDSTRCRRWELFTLGVRLHGRVLLVAWALLPYPWPPKQVTPTVVALLDRTLACWPADRPVHLVADRGFPSLPLFRCLERWRTSPPLAYTIRLRAGDGVHLAAGRTVPVGALLAQGRPGTWTTIPAAYHARHGASPAALLVVGRGQPVIPAHQRGPADTARRHARQARRAAHLRSKGHPHAVATDRVWALLSTAPIAQAAVEHDTERFSTEGTYRDLKAWGLEAVAAHETDPLPLEGLVGLAALAYLVQAALGTAAGCTGDGPAQARQHLWSTTDRLSSFWRGRQVLHDRAHDWTTWLGTTLAALTQRLCSSPSMAHQEAA